MTKSIESLPHVRAAHVPQSRDPLLRRRRMTVPLMLALLWPGLGHLLLARWRRSLAFAAPPAIGFGVAGTLAAADPAAAAVALLSPVIAAVLIGLIALHAAWRIAAIFDTWRIGRRGVDERQGGAPALVLMLGAFVLTLHIAAAAFVSSFASAGGQIFQGDRPTGGAAIDEILGGSLSSRPGEGSTADRPGGVGAPVPDEQGLTDTNGDGVIDWNDDGWIEDDPGDGWGEPIDDEQPGEAANPLGSPGEQDIPPPPLTPDDLSGGHPGDGPINVLFVGLDSGLDRTHSLSDTLMLASYHPGTDRLTMISIPRDTGRLPLYTGGTYPRRINTFLSYAGANPRLFPEGPIAALMREVGYVLGTRVHYYAATNLDGLPRVVELVGGVDVVLDRQIADPKWNLFLQPGVHHLDGQSVMPFVRSRYGPGNSDWQRARRQQRVIRGVAARVKDPAVALRLPQIIDGLSEVVRTNVPRGEVPTLLRILERANEASAEHVVLSPNAYARRIPMAETGGRYMTELKMAAVRQLSLRVFGSYSRYD